VDSRRVTPAFRLVVFILLALVLLFFIAAVGLSMGIANPTKSQSNAEAKLFGAATYTLTALLSVFAGKVV
jgi:hypothetical protein